MVNVTITWSDGDTFTGDLSIDAIKWYQDEQNVSVIFIPDEPTVTEPEPTPTPTTEQPTTQEPITETTQGPTAFMELVSISPGVFQILHDRIVGEVLYIASTAFEDPHARAFMQVKSLDGTVLVLRENDLNFFPTERDERIFFNESAFGETEVTVELFVWEFTEPIPLSASKSFNITALKPTVQPPFTPPIGIQPTGVAGTPFGIAAIGLMSLGVLGSLLGGKKKK